MIRVLFAFALTLLALTGVREAGAGVTASMERSPGGVPYVRLHKSPIDDVLMIVSWSSDWATRADVNQAVPFIGTSVMVLGGDDAITDIEKNDWWHDLGASMNLVPGPQGVTASVSAKRPTLDRAVRLANAQLRAPDLPEDRLEYARMIAPSAAEGPVAMPNNKDLVALNWALYGHSPLQRALNGERRDSVAAVQRADVTAWHKAVFSRQPARIVIAGDVDAEAAGKAVDALLSGLAEGEAVTPSAPPADLRARRILLHAPQALTSSIMLVGPLMRARTAEDKILLAGLSMELLEAAHDRLPAAYGLNWIDSSTGDPSFFGIKVNIAPDKMAAAERVLRQAYGGYHARGRAKPGYGKAELMQGLSENQREISFVAADAMSGLETGEGLLAVTAPDAYVATVTDESLRVRMAEAFPAPGDLTIIAVSPDAASLPGACVITRPEQAADCH